MPRATRRRRTECVCNRKTLWWLRLCLTCKAGKVYKSNTLGKLVMHGVMHDCIRRIVEKDEGYVATVWAT
jgi:hypothetical protein